MGGAKLLQAEISHHFYQYVLGFQNVIHRLPVFQKCFLGKKKRSTIITIILVLAEPKDVRLMTPLCSKEAHPSIPSKSQDLG